VKNWDAIVVGAGIIGLALALELNKRGLRVLVVEKGEPGREASWAAGGCCATFRWKRSPNCGNWRRLARECIRSL